MKKEKIERYLLLSNIIVSILIIAFFLVRVIFRKIGTARLSALPMEISGYFGIILFIFLVLSNLVVCIYVFAKRNKKMYFESLFLFLISFVFSFVIGVSMILNYLTQIFSSDVEYFKILDYLIIIMISLYYFWKDK